MKFALITGVSKGLGESVATFLLESQINVIGVSRTNNDKLEKIAEENNVIYEHEMCDLSDMIDVENVLSSTIRRFEKYDISVVYVINNAATIEPINPVINIEREQLQYHFTVNVMTPMVILNTLLKHFAHNKTTVIGVNVTSGAANSPIYGWSAYSSSKASIDSYTKTAALEVKKLNTDHKVIGFNPGVMDTDMQEQIRATDEQSFKDVNVFKSYKINKILKDTDIVAGILVDIITDEVNIENGKTYDVKDYY